MKCGNRKRDKKKTKVLTVYRYCETAFDIETSIRSHGTSIDTTSSNMERLRHRRLVRRRGLLPRRAAKGVWRGGVWALRGRDSVILNSSPLRPTPCYLPRAIEPRLARFGTHVIRLWGGHGGDGEGNGGREGIHPGIHEHPEDRSRGSLPAAAEYDDTGPWRARRWVYTSRTNKKERLENCASLVSPGWKPDRKVAGGMVESGARRIRRAVKYFYALNFHVVISRGGLAMLMRGGGGEGRGEGEKQEHSIKMRKFLICTGSQTGEFFSKQKFYPISQPRMTDGHTSWIIERIGSFTRDWWSPAS